MKPPRRELADHGAFEAKPADRRWRFWCGDTRTFEATDASVVTHGSTWMIARERAVVALARRGVVIAGQDLFSEPAVSELNGAAK